MQAYSDVALHAKNEFQRLLDAHADLRETALAQARLFTLHFVTPSMLEPGSNSSMCYCNVCKSAASE